MREELLYTLGFIATLCQLFQHLLLPLCAHISPSTVPATAPVHQCTSAPLNEGVGGAVGGAVGSVGPCQTWPEPMLLTLMWQNSFRSALKSSTALTVLF